VMNRGRGRQDIFHNEKYFEVFLQTLGEAHQRFGVEERTKGQALINF
jgi:putative transposase